MKDRKVEVKFKNDLYNCSLMGETRVKGNRTLFLFSLSYNEALALVQQIMEDL